MLLPNTVPLEFLTAGQCEGKKGREGDEHFLELRAKL